MVNLLAEMGVQPETLQSNLVPGVPSTDFTPPSAAIIGLGGPAVVGHEVQIIGISGDVGGGVVAGTEVSTDGGLTWHKASGLDHWTYAWTPTHGGDFTILARSVDDSLNLGAPTSFDVSVNPAIAVLENTALVAVIGDPAASLDLLSPCQYGLLQLRALWGAVRLDRWQQSSGFGGGCRQPGELRCRGRC